MQKSKKKLSREERKAQDKSRFGQSGKPDAEKVKRRKRNFLRK